MEGGSPEQSGRGNGKGERKKDCVEITRKQRENVGEMSKSKEIVWNEHDKEKERAAKAECENDKALNVLDTLLLCS